MGYMCPLARDRCPLTVLRLATGLELDLSEEGGYPLWFSQEGPINT